MSSLKDIVTKGMIYDPNSPNFLTQIEKLPEFKSFKHPMREDIFRYIALMYDLNTPMVSEVGDYYSRKRYCAELCGFPKKDDEFEPEYEGILLMKDEVVTTFIIIFIASFASADYMQLVYSWESMIQLFVNSATSADKNSVETMRKLKEDINLNTINVFKSDPYVESLEARKLLYKTAEYKRLNLRPENIAQRLFDGHDFSEFSPYGEGYKVEQLKFIDDTEPK